MLVGWLVACMSNRFINNDKGNPFYDFYMGRSFAPFIGPLDLKFFCEQRPGLMAWCLFNFAFALKQYEVLFVLLRYYLLTCLVLKKKLLLLLSFGSTKLHGYVTTSMVLVNVFHYIYVVDTFVFEVSMSTKEKKMLGSIYDIHCLNLFVRFLALFFFVFCF